MALRRGAATDGWDSDPKKKLPHPSVGCLVDKRVHKPQKPRQHWVCEGCLVFKQNQLGLQAPPANVVWGGRYAPGVLRWPVVHGDWSWRQGCAGRGRWIAPLALHSRACAQPLFATFSIAPYAHYISMGPVWPNLLRRASQSCVARR